MRLFNGMSLEVLANLGLGQRAVAVLISIGKHRSRELFPKPVPLRLRNYRGCDVARKPHGVNFVNARALATLRATDFICPCRNAVCAFLLLRTHALGTNARRLGTRGALESHCHRFTRSHRGLDHIDDSFLVSVAHVNSIDCQNPIVGLNLARRCRRTSSLHCRHLATDFTVRNMCVVVRQSHPQLAARGQHDIELQTQVLPLLTLRVFGFAIRLSESGPCLVENIY